MRYNASGIELRTILTATGVVVGILTIVTMVSLGVGVQREIQNQFAALGLENVFVSPRQAEADFFNQFSAPQRQTPITPEVLNRWRAQPNVVSAEGVIDLNGVNMLLELPGANGQPVQRRVRAGNRLPFANPFQGEPQVLAGTTTLSAEQGQIALSRAVLPPGSEPAALVGQQVAIVLQSPRGEQQRFPLTVVGVSDNDAPEVLVSANDRAAMKAWWFNTPNYLATQGYDSATVRATNVGEAATLVRAFRSEGFSVQSLEIILDTANRTFALLNLMLSSVGALALFVASLGIANTMMMSIYERTREIGTLKAIGAGRGDIRGMFMLEAGMIGLIGGVVGVVGGWLVGLGMNPVLLYFIRQEGVDLQATFFVTPWWLVLAALGFAALIGVLAGLYPAARAARLDPLVALRYD
ncbi:MAG: ABC transporter permease [Chloroflexaceae bacterium]|nr:ABC transporter permease [Chloroflexaceae bacterium]